MATISSIAGNPASSSSRAHASLKTVAWNIASLVLALLVWQVAAMLVASPFFPVPLRIVDAFMQLATRGDTLGISLWAHSWASIERVLVGFGLGWGAGW